MSFRQLRTKQSNAGHDRGAVLLWFSVMAVAMLGMGALVVDTGALYSERRQLQNGADAAALAVAGQCAYTTCRDYSSTAQQYANFNSQDGASTVDQVCGFGPGLASCSAPPASVSGFAGNYVHVQTGTQDASGGSLVKFLFAPIMDGSNVGSRVTASATVGWGLPSSAPVLPLVLPACFFPLGVVQPDGSLVFPTTTINFSLHDGGTCSLIGGPNGFDFTEDPSGTCAVSGVNIVGGTVNIPAGDSGTSPTCRIVIDSLLGKTAVFPVATGYTPAGSASYYTVTGFAAITICGFALGGGFIENDCPDPAVCSGGPNVTRICGIFAPMVLEDGEIGRPAGGSGDFGVRVIKMIG